MPELPEVETIRRQLDPVLRGRTVLDAGAHESSKFASATGAVGGTFEGVGRRGKYLLAALDLGGAPHTLVIHLGMTGSLRPSAGALDSSHLDDPYVRAWWRLDDGVVVRYRDVRRFGRIALISACDTSPIRTLATLGPEPFDDGFTPEQLWRSVRASRRHVKTQLLSQRPVAGVGNIYADEALWRAGVHPARRSITRVQAARLRDSIREVLAEGIEHGGTTLRDYVSVTGGAGTNQLHLDCYGRAGEPCPRCGETLRRIVLDARTTTFCPTCQPRR